jgi:glyoxylase-like metal-dependent hydrolase (beta-lactamase superfamily II)
MPTPEWERFEAFLWRTSSLLVLAEGESLVFDPAISGDEVAKIGRRALELGAPVRHVLITHGTGITSAVSAAFPMRWSRWARRRQKG